MEKVRQIYTSLEPTVYVEPLRNSYRQKLATVLGLVKAYKGETRQREALLEHLIGLETWMREVFGEEKTLSLELERAVSRVLLDGKDWSIQEILDRTTKRYSRWIERALKESADNANGLIISDMNGVLLPPGDMLVFSGHGEHQFEDVRLQQRLRQLLELLHEHEIYSDDVIIVRGSVYEGQMRHVPYNLVEIPYLKKQILVCDEVGEATFVMRKILDRNIFLKMSKECLQEELAGVVMKVVYRDCEQWGGEIMDVLLEDGENVSKVDVRSQEGLRQEIKKKIPTPEGWVGMKAREKQKFGVCGKKLNAIARKFGVEGNSVSNRSVYLELGRVIYGDHPTFEVEEEKDWSMEEIREEIKREVPTPEEWAGMKAREKKKFGVCGKKLRALSTKFGVEGNPTNNHSVHLELGRVIYGDHPIFEVDEGKDWSMEEIREEIKREVPTPEEWAGMNKKEKLKFGVCGKKLCALATKFGVEGDPTSNHSVHLELGRGIYGDYPAFEVEEEKEWSEEEVRVEIKKQVSTAEVWVEMKFREKQKFKVCGKKLNAIARKFGVEGNPVNKLRVYLDLGREIYGDYPVFEVEEEKEWGVEEIREEIKKQVSMPEEWVEMTSKEKQKFEACGKKLNALARKFGVEGNPIGYHSVHLDLGRAIYGDHTAFEEKEWSVEEIREEIKKKMPTPEAWGEMKVREKRKLEVCGKKLNALATKFGVEGNPADNHSVYLELGRVIYGDHPTFEVEEEKDWSMEEIREEIKKEMPTRVGWAAMNKKEKQKFEVCGKNLTALARKFGVEGTPTRNHSVYLELGRVIYGDHAAFEEKEWSVEEARIEVKKKVPTAEEWAEMKAKQKRKLEVCGKKLTALATKFGVEGDTIGNHRIYLELGRAIYGDHPVLKEWSEEEVRVEIKKQVPTPEEWAGMNYKEKLKFKVCGKKLRALSTKFGVEGDPANNSRVHLELGWAIYGDHPAFDGEENI